MARSKKSKDVVVPDLLKPAEPRHWRLIVDFTPDLTSKVRAESERLGVDFQATVKTLVDEALRLRSQATKVMQA